MRLSTGFLIKTKMPQGLITLMDTHIASCEQYTNRTHFIVEACKEKILRDQQYYEHLKKKQKQ